MPVEDEILALFRESGSTDLELVVRVLRQTSPDEWPEEKCKKLLDLGRPSAKTAEELVGWIFNSAAESVPQVVFVVGGPGCGKGTFSTRIVEQFGYTHLSAGDLLRAERNRPGSEVGELIEKTIKDGKIVPSEITVGLVEQEMRRIKWEGGKYLIDGFPRNVANFDAWKKVMGNKAMVKFTFFIECSMECMERRLLKRGETSGRSDDNLETIRKRFVTFENESRPVLEILEKHFPLRKVDSEPGIDAVWHEVEAIFA